MGDHPRAASTTYPGRNDSALVDRFDFPKCLPFLPASLRCRARQRGASRGPSAAQLLSVGVALPRTEDGVASECPDAPTTTDHRGRPDPQSGLCGAASGAARSARTEQTAPVAGIGHLPQWSDSVSRRRRSLSTAVADRQSRPTSCHMVRRPDRAPARWNARYVDLCNGPTEAAHRLGLLRV